MFLAWTIGFAASDIGFKIATPSNYTLVEHGTYNGSLYKVELPSE